MAIWVIAGSRGIWLADTLAAIEATPGVIDTVISGLAPGSDTHAIYWAEWNGKPVIRRPADWKRNGKAAGPLRNRVMAKETDYAIVVWDGESRGSADMVRAMEALDKPYELYGPRPADSDIERGTERVWVGDDGFSD